MKRVWTILVLALLVPAMTCGSVWAQATAQIAGSVQDTSGAVLPGVEVTATQTDTGVSRATITNETGYYVLPNLPLGPYRLEAALPGFRTFAQTGIVLLYEALQVPCVPVALNSGLFWPRRSLIRKPGTVVVEILDPIPPGLPKAEFLQRLKTETETASNRLIAEAQDAEPHRRSAVNPSLS